MSSILFVLLSIGVSLSSAQWMPYLEPQNMSPFGHQMADHLIAPKEPSNKIPIILLLKPKRAKSLSADTSSESVERHQIEADSPLSLNEWMGMPHMNTDHMVGPQHMSATEYEMSAEPDQEASEGDEVTVVKGRAGEQVKWPQTFKKNGVTAEQLASISHLFPKLAALSTSSSDTSDQNNKNTGALFEEALKKFTSNLTDFEHRNNEDNDKNSEEDSDQSENSTESSIESHNSGITDILKSGSTEDNDNSNDNSEEKKPYIVEQRDSHQRLSPQKSRPFISDRNRIRIPIKSEVSHQKIDSIHTVGQPSHKGWVPIKGKHKPKGRPSKPAVIKTETHLYFPSEASNPMSGQYLYQNSDRQVFGMPETLNAIASVDPPPHMFRPRHFPHSYIPYDTKHTISHLPYHKYNSQYSSYLTDTDLSPALMEMTADANKPQHIEPNKPGEEGADKTKDIIETKEHMIDNKHVINEKHMIVDEKAQAIHGLGEDLLGQHLSCCDILNGGQTGGAIGPHQVIHEEVIHKPEFDDDKIMANMGNMGIPEAFHKTPEHYPPVHFGPNFGSKFGPYFQHKKQCLHPFPSSSYPRPYWPQQSYRRPVYRPKFFYKPLLFG